MDRLTDEQIAEILAAATKWAGANWDSPAGATAPQVVAMCHELQAHRQREARTCERCGNYWPPSDDALACCGADPWPVDLRCTGGMCDKWRERGQQE